MWNDAGHYVLTDDDITAYKRMLDSTYDLSIRSSGEREMETHGNWRIFAPAKDRIFYTADGFTLAEAVEHWFAYIKEMGTEPFFRE